MYAVKGNTYPIRIYLTMTGCIWNGQYWQTEDANLKTRLQRMGLSPESLRRIKLEKILKKVLDSNSE